MRSMKTKNEILEQFKREYALTKNRGFESTNVEGVKFYWFEEPVDMNSLVYPSGVCFLIQGQKSGYFDDQMFQYDTEHFLVVSVSTPLQCRSYASPEQPLFGLCLELNVGEISKMITEMGGKHELKGATTRGVEPVKIHPELDLAVERLMNALLSKAESKVLGKHLLKEVFFRVLQSDHGKVLSDITEENSNLARINKVVEYINLNLKEKLTVEMLANQANMSVTSFHRTFKTMTGCSPVQYIKRIRLSRARSMIVHDGMKAKVAAGEVGYDSVSQFSREFKRYFSVPPAQSRGTGYADIDVYSA